MDFVPDSFLAACTIKRARPQNQHMKRRRLHRPTLRHNRPIRSPFASCTPCHAPQRFTPSLSHYVYEVNLSLSTSPYPHLVRPSKEREPAIPTHGRKACSIGLLWASITFYTPSHAHQMAIPLLARYFHLFDLSPYLSLSTLGPAEETDPTSLFRAYERRHRITREILSSSRCISQSHNPLRRQYRRVQAIVWNCDAGDSLARPE